MMKADGGRDGAGSGQVTSLGPSLWRVVVHSGVGANNDGAHGSNLRSAEPGSVDNFVDIFYVDLVEVAGERRFRVRRLQNPSGRWALLGEFWDLESAVGACERTAASLTPSDTGAPSGPPSLWSSRRFGPQDARLLDFEAANPVSTPSKDSALAQEFGLTPEAYRRQLRALTRSREAAIYAPNVIRKLLIEADHGRYTAKPGRRR